MVRVGIAGGSGYGGIELIHILLRHPHAEITWVSSQQHAGKTLAEVHPHFRRFTDLRFAAVEALAADQLDVLFLALPHGHAMKIAPGLPSDLIVIDLSGDFRLTDSTLFEEFYGFPQSSPDEQKKFVYGLPEINREKIRSAHRVANPGCFATATILALHPLVQENCLCGPIFVDSKTGSSGAGHTPLTTTHHPRRSNSLFAYKAFRHQHLPEIIRTLGPLEYPLIFQPYSAPFVRGIFASHYVQLAKPLTNEDVRGIYESYYGSDYFIRWVDGCPDVNTVRHSNFVDIGAASQDGFLIVWSVLDNLQKGAAGQAVQNMNLICGFPEEAALQLPPVYP